MPDQVPLDPGLIDPTAPRTGASAADSERDRAPEAASGFIPGPDPASAPAPGSAADEMRAVERKLAVARNRLVHRLVEVSRRVERAREKLDVVHMIRTHPFAAAGLGLGAGALLALPGSGKDADGQRRGRTVPMRLGGLLGTLAVGLARDALGAWIRRAIAAHDATAGADAHAGG
ncbi:MAG TPA: hypothetical protein VHE35_09355 [Kofleriaceae bacterium]|nr:hypothetical protein [Kofleriaceae bacterium]